uniref:Cathelicidin-related peptide lutzicidin-like n=1 Tax=Monodelphis domestica TaxID=13616 RepID=K7E2B6_MONDO
MGSPGRSLLVLCVALTIATLSAQRRRGLSDQEALSLFLKIYNRDSSDNAIFRLRESQPVLREGRTLTLNATIQETNCLKSENRNPDQCEFNERGLVRDCSGKMSPDRHPLLVVIVCDSVPSQVTQNQDVLQVANLNSHGKRKRRSSTEGDVSLDAFPDTQRRFPRSIFPRFFPRPRPIFRPRPGPNLPGPPPVRPPVFQPVFNVAPPPPSPPHGPRISLNLPGLSSIPKAPPLPPGPQTSLNLPGFPSIRKALPLPPGSWTGLNLPSLPSIPKVPPPPPGRRRDPNFSKLLSDVLSDLNLPDLLSGPWLGPNSPSPPPRPNSTSPPPGPNSPNPSPGPNVPEPETDSDFP